MLEAKQVIARAACQFIKNEDFIALDAGTTSLELARLLPTLPLTSLGVVTPDLEIALLLSGCDHISVFLSGGLIDPVSRACNDSDAVAYLRGLRLTMAFVGTNVWDAHHGVTTSTSAKMHYKRQLMPILRTSVDHGTAFDIAGTGKVSAVSMVEAIRLAAEYAPNFKRA